MAFTRVADGVLVRTGRRMATTTTIVFRPSGVPAGRVLPGRRAGALPAVLVDPAWDADELEAIADELDALAVRPAAGFSTHAHYDHLLWHPRYGDVPRWASEGSVRVVRERRDELVEQLLGGDPERYPKPVLDLFAHVTEVPDPPSGLPDLDDALPRTEVVVHDGHEQGHSALWLPESGVLVVGDMLSDAEIPLPYHPDNLPAYLAGLDRLAPYVEAAAVLVPGHGTPSYTPVERLDADRRYLDAVLAGREPDDPRLANRAMAEEHERLVRAFPPR
ncbi:MBL fold metallo-hydrolase [Antribacter sp. KLBMP9083]|uniref:MBL fold metallo-hydrolase n=1 Tax=Antribacter soli TaxID=2910976 RepID=A0AA41UAD6_9MICO|nr:MBL fold metallo-hydrolase [Antribacter soli]MCF4120029.1 MBL fold metallo-hydrolase [Antribacter soli]